MQPIAFDSLGFTSASKFAAESGAAASASSLETKLDSPVATT
ncbi:MAG: hypothetical protein BWX66_02141 [Deltaproteobacteria bacterium ADurb.Bin058]|nr:MAG: hypothetical protein BWX66_02141 [Deltaproteobacteria bacterium ADurb.Bin058]